MTLGTVASAKANSSLAPLRMMPPYSWLVPGMKPGTSSSVTSGRLKASQKRTKRAPLMDEALSSTPASALGWLATMPTGRPPKRAKPVTRLGAQAACTSRKSRSSTMAAITSLTS